MTDSEMIYNLYSYFVQSTHAAMFWPSSALVLIAIVGAAAYLAVGCLNFCGDIFQAYLDHRYGMKMAGSRVDGGSGADQ